MKHTDFKTVQRYVQEIEAINLDLVHVTGGGSGLGVTIQGRYQDDTIVNQVRPVVVGILQRAKAERILALRELGVDIPDEPVAITDAERIDHLEHLVSEAYVSACFEMDGGVHLTIERPSSSAEAHRNKDTLRDAIDDAIKAAAAAPSPQLPLIPGDQ